jgi:hypothetical protein
MNMLFFIGVCFVIILFSKFLYYNPSREGMTTNSSSSTSSSANGIAVNAASYAAAIKALTIKSQDVLLINKYKSDYESVILNLDDLINNLMLNTALSVDTSNPSDSIDKLAKMQQAKVALNSVMKFIDSN